MNTVLPDAAVARVLTVTATYINPDHPEVDQTVSAALDVPVVGTWVGGFATGVLKEIHVDGASTVKQGESIKLTASILLYDGNKVDVSNMANWSVDAHATVDKTGKVTGTSVGTARVSAKFAGVTGNLNISVTA